MARITRYIALALVLILVAPSAMATWRALGSYEPDTVYDTPNWMFENPNVDRDVNRVYLNVVSTQYLTSTNPNMLVEDSRILSVPTYTLEALYGVWVDCNQDGYIGMADSALLEYRSELLPPDHICGADSKENMHNQQGWVSELRWIGPRGGADGDGDGKPDGRDARLINDFGARIWGDNGLPGQQVNAPAPSTCKLFYHMTGQVLNYADCVLGLNSGQDLEPVNGALTALGLGFEPGEDGTDYDQPHPLNLETFGEDDGANPGVQVYDCSAGRQGIQTGLGANQGTEEVPIGTTGYSVYAVQYTDEDGELNLSVYRSYNLNGSSEPNYLARRDVTYFTPAPSVGGGSIAGTYNHTTDGTTGDCDASNGGGNIYFQESPAVDVRQPGKRSVDIEFSFREEQRSGAGKRGEPFERGIYPVARSGALVLFSGHRWFGGNWAGNSPSFIRADLEPAGARYFTFYANMTSNTLALNNLVLPGGGATGKYGDEWCGGATSGIERGFNCDPDQWYINPDGSRPANREFAVLAGHEYHLRDVDCYDYRVGSGPVYLSGAMLSPSAACAE